VPRRLLATLAFGLTLAAGFALGTIARSPSMPAVETADADIPTLPPTAAVFVAVNAQDAGEAERHLYPAPLTALHLADSLNLDEPQRSQLRQVQHDTETEISALGRRLGAEQRRLARAFAENNVDATRIDALTARIAALDGRIRALQLRSHLATREALTPDQLLRLASLRGYEPAPDNERADDPLR
jgi:Spy/CpxP family protein refolding chaperone